MAILNCPRMPDWHQSDFKSELPYLSEYTVKSLIEAWAFIRIITFSGEGGGRLLEAVVLANYV